MVSQLIIRNKICLSSTCKGGIEKEVVILHPEGGRGRKEKGEGGGGRGERGEEGGGEGGEGRRGRGERGEEGGGREERGEGRGEEVKRGSRESAGGEEKKAAAVVPVDSKKEMNSLRSEMSLNGYH